MIKNLLAGLLGLLLFPNYGHCQYLYDKLSISYSLSESYLAIKRHNSGLGIKSRKLHTDDFKFYYRLNSRFLIGLGIRFNEYNYELDLSQLSLNNIPYYHSGDTRLNTSLRYYLNFKPNRFKFYSEVSMSYFMWENSGYSNDFKVFNFDIIVSPERFRKRIFSVLSLGGEVRVARRNFFFLSAEFGTILGKANTFKIDFYQNDEIIASATARSRGYFWGLQLGYRCALILAQPKLPRNYAPAIENLD